ncbi:MAG: hypothetical protein ABIP90_02210 [Vicinamibacterales bacterium]
MMDTQNKIVSIEVFRAKAPAERWGGTMQRAPIGDRPHLSVRGIEHRERMLQFLRTEARHAGEAREVQGRLLL